MGEFEERPPPGAHKTSPTDAFACRQRMNSRSLSLFRYRAVSGFTPPSSPVPYLSTAAHTARSARRVTVRATCRWAAVERYGTGEDGGVNPLTARYLNRLSDLLFILCRQANASVGDVLWAPGGGRSDPPSR